MQHKQKKKKEEKKIIKAAKYCCCMSCYRKAIAVNYRRQLVHVFPSGSQVFEHFVEY